MQIVFHEDFLDSSYINDAASAAGRISVIVEALKSGAFTFVKPYSASDFDILLAHSESHLRKIKEDQKLMHMASLAAGSAIVAADLAMQNKPAFSCARPPGHHAGKNASWGYCCFCNMAIALLKLKQQGKINSAFVLDFDAHTGDGTIECLQDWPECIIFNPYAEDRGKYIELIQERVNKVQKVDVVAICAGFDTYEKDVGRKLKTFDFYQIGIIMKKFSKRAAQGKRFALLEGGYFLPDLGKNVLAFCQGFTKDKWNA